MTDKKICDCNQGRLPCSCIAVEPGTQETLAAACTTPAGNQCSGDGVGACKTCNGRGLVDDGEINCFEDGTPYSNGPVKCVKECPDCRPRRASAIQVMAMRPLPSRDTFVDDSDFWAACHQAAGWNQAVLQHGQIVAWLQELYECNTAIMLARTEALSRTSNLLGNLLAVIHRDGGHYQDQHGLNKACADAKTLVLEEREQLRLLKEAGEQLADHFTKQMDIGAANLEAANLRMQQLYEMLGVTDLVQAKARIEKLLGEEAEAYALADQVRGLQELMANQEPVAEVIVSHACEVSVRAIRGKSLPPEGGKLYAAPVAPVALRSAFMTSLSGNGRYEINLKFDKLPDAQAAHDYLLKLVGALPKRADGGR